MVVFGEVRIGLDRVEWYISFDNSRRTTSGPKFKALGGYEIFSGNQQRRCGNVWPEVSDDKLMLRSNIWGGWRQRQRRR